MEYMQVDSLYKSKLENAIGILLPAITLAMPAGKVVFKFAKQRFQERKVAIVSMEEFCYIVLVHPNGNKLKLMS